MDAMSSTWDSNCWSTSRAQASSLVYSFAERLDVVAAAPAPRDVPQVEPVVDAVVGEGREAVLVDGVPQPQLGGDPVVEPVEDRQTVAALGSRGETKSSRGWT